MTIEDRYVTCALPHLPREYFSLSLALSLSLWITYTRAKEKIEKEMTEHEPTREGQVHQGVEDWTMVNLDSGHHLFFFSFFHIYSSSQYQINTICVTSLSVIYSFL